MNCIQTLFVPAIPQMYLLANLSNDDWVKIGITIPWNRHDNFARRRNSGIASRIHSITTGRRNQVCDARWYPYGIIEIDGTKNKAMAEKDLRKFEKLIISEWKNSGIDYRGREYFRLSPIIAWRDIENYMFQFNDRAGWGWTAVQL